MHAGALGKLCDRAGADARPLVLGYSTAAVVLDDVAVGLLVCVATLATLEWPRTRFVMAAPALWLLAAARANGDATAATAEMTAGGLLLALALVPSARRAPRPAPPLSPPERRAGARV